MKMSQHSDQDKREKSPRRKNCTFSRLCDIIRCVQCIGCGCHGVDAGVGVGVGVGEGTDIFTRISVLHACTHKNDHKHCIIFRKKGLG
jgi:hypothetical protein